MNTSSGVCHRILGQAQMSSACAPAEKGMTTHLCMCSLQTIQKLQTCIAMSLYGPTAFHHVDVYLVKMSVLQSDACSLPWATAFLWPRPHLLQAC